MLLRGAGIISYSEPHTSKGRANVVLQFNNSVIALEFNFAKDSSEVEDMKLQVEHQIKERGYTNNYNAEGRKIISAVLVADDEHRKIIM